VGGHKECGNEDVYNGYALYPYEYLRMKSVEIVLRNRGGGKEEE
jgi:hypothetical protein